jgi:phage shock protein E
MAYPKMLPRELLLLFVVTLVPSMPPSALGADDAVDTRPIPQSLLLEFLADDSTFTLIDARSPEEFDESHITGAVNVPVESVDQLLSRLPEDRSELIVVYCRTGKRAARLQSELNKRGYTDVRVLRSKQIVWFDDLAVFDCATSASDEFTDNETASLTVGLPEDSK